ncbi:MAG: hypothetical protein Q9169_006250 [Polycauliona sp. 2 TL-2023]
MSDHLPSSTRSSSSTQSDPSSVIKAWLASHPPRARSRRRSQSEGPSATLDPTHLNTSSPRPSKRVCLAQSKSAPVSPKHSSAVTRPLSTPPPFSLAHPTASQPNPAPLDPASSAATSSNPKPVQTQKDRPSYAKRRVKRILQIINTTFAVCEGNPSQSPAYPVHPIGVDRFLVPATFSDFRVLQNYKSRSDASRAIVNFERATTIPGHLQPTTCIRIKMLSREHEAIRPCVYIVMIARLRAAGWTLNNQRMVIEELGTACEFISIQLKLRLIEFIAIEGKTRHSGEQKVTHPEPDGSIYVQGQRIPFLIMEMANSQSDKSLDQKIRMWSHGTHDALKIILAFKIRPHPTAGFRVLASVVRLRKEIVPTAEDPQNYRMARDYLINEEEIYPSESDASFTMYRADMLPKGTVENTTPAAAPVTIGLFEFSVYAEAAVRIANEIKAGSQHSSHQGSPSPPP